MYSKNRLYEIFIQKVSEIVHLLKLKLKNCLNETQLPPWESPDWDRVASFISTLPTKM